MYTTYVPLQCGLPNSDLIPQDFFLYVIEIKDFYLLLLSFLIIEVNLISQFLYSIIISLLIDISEHYFLKVC